jgi:hypothetical protein
VSFRPALLALVVLAALPRLHAEPGLTGAQTLLRPLSARAVGMAETFTAVDGGLDSLGYNPAGLARLERPQLQTTYVRGIASDDFGFLGYAHPLTGATLTGGLVYYNAGSVNLNLSDGTQATVTAEQDFVGLMSLGVPLGWGLCAGGTAKYYSLTLAQQASAKGFAGDLGMLWHSPLKGLNLGAAVENLGPDVKFEQTGDPLPTTARFGAAYAIDLTGYGYLQKDGYGFSHFLLTADAVKLRDESTLLPAAGLEMGMGLGELGSCALRFGYMFEQDLANFTFGVGLRESRWRLDYAFGVMRADVSPTNQVSLGVDF